MKKINKGTIIEIIIFFIIAISPLYAWEIAKIMLHNPYPIQVVEGNSMSPTLNVGDIILIENVNPKDITNGTIISFYSPIGGVYTHRVIGVEIMSDKYYFRTKGDALDSPDSWLIPENYVIGKVIARIPLIGYLILIPRIYLALFFMIIIAIDVIYVFYLKKILRKKKMM
ncbi:MAG: signal peptidase I [Nitrososphaerota archaeon]